MDARRQAAGRKAAQTRRHRRWMLEEAQRRGAAVRRQLLLTDCVFNDDQPGEPCWGEVTCWFHDAPDHPACEALCTGHRDIHPGNHFTGHYHYQKSL